MNEIDKSNVYENLEMTKALLAMMLSEEKDISFGRSSHSNVNTSIFTYDIWGRNKCDVPITKSYRHLDMFSGHSKGSVKVLFFSVISIYMFVCRFIVQIRKFT